MLGPQAWHPTAACPGSPSCCRRRPAHLGGIGILLVRERAARGHPRGAAARHPAAPLWPVLSAAPGMQTIKSKRSSPFLLLLLLLLLFSRKSSYFMCRCSSRANWLGTRRRKCQEQLSIAACPRPPGSPGTTRTHSVGQGAPGWPSKPEAKRGFRVWRFLYSTLARAPRDAGCQQLDLDPHDCVVLPARSIFRMTETQHICSAPQGHLLLLRAMPRGHANPSQQQLRERSSSPASACP